MTQQISATNEITFKDGNNHRKYKVLKDDVTIIWQVRVKDRWTNTLIYFTSGEHIEFCVDDLVEGKAEVEDFIRNFKPKPCVPAQIIKPSNVEYKTFKERYKDLTLKVINDCINHTHAHTGDTMNWDFECQPSNGYVCVEVSFLYDREWEGHGFFAFDDDAMEYWNDFVKQVTSKPEGAK